METNFNNGTNQEANYHLFSTHTSHPFVWSILHFANSAKPIQANVQIEEVELSPLLLLHTTSHHSLVLSVLSSYIRCTRFVIYELMQFHDMCNLPEYILST